MKISFEKLGLFNAIVVSTLIALVIANNQFHFEYYEPIAIVLIVLLSIKIKKCGSAETPPTLLK